MFCFVLIFHKLINIQSLRCVPNTRTQTRTDCVMLWPHTLAGWAGIIIVTMREIEPRHKFRDVTGHNFSIFFCSPNWIDTMCLPWRISGRAREPIWACRKLACYAVNASKYFVGFSTRRSALANDPW